MGEDDDDSDSENKSVKKVPVMTTFYKDLQTLQKRYYIHLRASIVLYMDDKQDERLLHHVHPTRGYPPRSACVQ